MAHLAILDAVRRKREGSKVRHLIEERLRSGGRAGLQVLVFLSCPFVCLLVFASR
jgi:hypothetical protein